MLTADFTNTFTNDDCLEAFAAELGDPNVIILFGTALTGSVEDRDRLLVDRFPSHVQNLNKSGYFWSSL